jgi:hypothetical protein
MKKLLVLVVVSAVGVGAWRWHSTPADSGSDAHLVQDRIWIDHVPKNDRDTFQVFLALTEQPVGIYQKTSAWQGSFEIFRYEMHGGELRVIFPQNGDRETVRAKARTCSEAGMDYCLELSGGTRGAKRYYSRKGWEVGSLADEQTKLDELAHAHE